MYSIRYRHAEEPSGAPFVEVLTRGTPQEAADEVMSWMGDGPSHGDLVRVQGPDHSKGVPQGTLIDMGPYDHIYVYDGNRGSFVLVEPHRNHTSWVTFWEDAAHPYSMIEHSKGVAGKRHVLVACDIAETAVKFVRDREQCRKALKLARLWVNGRAGGDELAAMSQTLSTYYEELASVQVSRGREVPGRVSFGHRGGRCGVCNGFPVGTSHRTDASYSPGGKVRRGSLGVVQQCEPMSSCVRPHHPALHPPRNPGLCSGRGY